MLSARQSGSRGTLTSSQRDATRAISASTASGSGTCSSTSIAVAASNSPSSKGSAVAGAGVELEVGARRAAPTPRAAWGRRGRCPTTRPDDAVGPLLGQDALAAADVDDRARRGAGPATRTCPARTRHQAPHDRVRGSVLVVGVAGRDLAAPAGAGGLASTAAPERSGRCSSVSPTAARRAARRARWPGHRGPSTSRGAERAARAGLVVRGLDAELQLDPARPLERALDQDPVVGQQVADHAQRGELHRDHEQHRSQHDRLHVALRPRPG